MRWAELFCCCVSGRRFWSAGARSVVPLRCTGRAGRGDRVGSHLADRPAVGGSTRARGLRYFGGVAPPLCRRRAAALPGPAGPMAAATVGRDSAGHGRLAAAAARASQSSVSPSRSARAAVPRSV